MFGLNLLVLGCGDFERARSFYECFGMTFTKHRHGDGPEHDAAEDLAGVFELYPGTPGAAGDLTGLGFVVADLAGTSKDLADRGFTAGATADRPWGRTFVVRDPDGRRVEVKQT